MRKLLVLAALLGLAAPAHAANPFKAPTKAVFDYLAKKKGDRVFHAEGIAYHATITDKAGNVSPAVARVSRGGAAKSNQADILGVAVKVQTEGGVQDFLMVSSKSDKGIGSHVPAFKAAYAGDTVSSLTNFKYKGVKGPYTSTMPTTMRTTLDSVGSGKAGGKQSFTIAQQKNRLFGPTTSTELEHVVTIDFDRPLSAEDSAQLKFTPFNQGGGLKPVGIFNMLREGAYIGSQLGRGVANAVYNWASK